MTEAAPLVWVDRWGTLQPTPYLRALHGAGRASDAVDEPLSTVIRRRAFEPSSGPYRGLPGCSVEIHHLDLQDVFATKLNRRSLPPPLARLICSSRHDIFLATERGMTFLIPAILLIETLWLWSARAAAHLMVPGSVDMHVGRLDSSNEMLISRALVGSASSNTALRRVAWLSQCDDARCSWSSVLTHALNGRISVEMPRVRLSGWAWAVETTSGLLVSDFNGVELDYDLPEPGALLRIGASRVRIPSEPAQSTGFMSFM